MHYTHEGGVFPPMPKHQLNSGYGYIMSNQKPESGILVEFQLCKERVHVTREGCISLHVRTPTKLNK